MGCWTLGRTGSAVGREGGREVSSVAMTLAKLVSSPNSSSIARQATRRGSTEYNWSEAANVPPRTKKLPSRATLVEFPPGCGCVGVG